MRPHQDVDAVDLVQAEPVDRGGEVPGTGRAGRAA